MAAPDDDHVCQPMYDDSGELLAVVHGSPDMSDRGCRTLRLLALPFAGHPDYRQELRQQPPCTHSLSPT